MVQCSHPSAKPWLTVSVDVKRDVETEFGKLQWCPDCEAGFVSPLPDASEIPVHYDLPNYYTHGQTHFPEVTPNLPDRLLTKLAWTFDEKQPRLPEFVGGHLPKLGSVLDVGCGHGANLGLFRKAGADVCGVEPDEVARELAQSKGIEVFAGTAEALPNEVMARKFDLVIMSHVLEHCTDPTHAVVSVTKVLSPGGMYYCEVPNAGAEYFRTYAQISEMLDVPRHLHFLTKAKLTQICDTVGLEIVDWRYSGYTRHFQPEWRAWENSIHDKIRAHGDRLDCGRRGFYSSLGLIARSAFAKPDKKFDTIGFLARLPG